MNRWNKFNHMIKLFYFRVKYKENYCVPLEMLIRH